MLGPVQVWVDGKPVPTGPPQRRLVLATLLVDAGRPVSPSTLADRIWAERPPAKPRAAIHAHMTGIRRMLAAAAPAGDPPPLTYEAGAGGYRLRVEPDRVDLHRFRELVARRPTTGPGLDRLRAAMRLWRGEPLSGLPGRWAHQVRESTRQEYLAAVTAWAAAEADAGFPERAIGPLAALQEQHPLDERLAAALIRALHDAGDTAGALRCYTEARSRLVEELGLEPGPELRRLHRAVLRGGPVAASAPAGGAPAGGVPAGGVPAGGAPAEPEEHPRRPPPVPAQLPADPRVFIGRTGQLRQLDAELGVEGRFSPSTVCVVTGPAGVGKTALAVHWAHRAARHFPGGVLYVNLRGSDPEQPASPADALAGFLTGLGVPGAEIPVDADGRAARYRTETAGRRLLVVLDNASSPEQVRPLLPGSGSARVVVTSRDAQSGLVAVDGAGRLDLDPLPAADAAALLMKLLQPARPAEPAAVEHLAARCARLPLALRIAAEVVRSRPEATLDRLGADLDDDRRSLDALDAGGDPRAAVRAVFSWSYRHLAADAARLFRLVGSQPAPDLDVHAAAALAGCEVPEARSLLDRLSRAHLLERGHGGTAGGERHAMHDLLRAYASGLAADVDHPADTRAALERLWTYYVAAAAAATDRLFPAEVHRRPAVPPADTPLPDFDSAGSARMWLDRERGTLALVTAYTADHGWPEQAVRLATVLVRYLTGDHFADALTIHGHAVRAARRLDDPNGEALAVLGLGGTYWRLGRYGEAVNLLERALTLYRRTGDKLGEARTLDNLGTVEGRFGDPVGGVDRKERALDLFRQLGDRVGEARVLGGLGDLRLSLGRHQAGADAFQQALELFRRSGDRLGEGAALDGLGLAAQALGRHGQALQHHLDALALFRELGYRNGEANVLDNIGDAHAGLGRAEEAAASHREALALHQRTGDRRGEVAALNGLGEAAHAGGRAAEAVAWHEKALALSEEIHDLANQAQAHAGLGRGYTAVGDRGRADGHLRQALAAYTELGHPRAAALREELSRPRPPRLEASAGHPTSGGS